MNEPEPDDPINLDGLSFETLRGRQDAAIVQSIRRLLEELNEPHDAVAGFQSSV